MTPSDRPRRGQPGTPVPDEYQPGDDYLRDINGAVYRPVLFDGEPAWVDDSGHVWTWAGLRRSAVGLVFAEPGARSVDQPRIDAEILAQYCKTYADGEVWEAACRVLIRLREGGESAR